MQGHVGSLSDLVDAWCDRHPGGWLHSMAQKLREWRPKLAVADVTGCDRENDEPGTLGEFAAWLGREGAHRVRVDVVLGARRRREWKDGASAQTIRHAVGVAARVLRWGAGRGFLRVGQIGDRPRLARPVRRPRDLQDGEVRRLLGSRLGAAEPLVRFVFATGARPGEACRLEWGDVDLARGVAVLRAAKGTDRTGQSRVIFLTAEAAAVLVGLGERRAGPVFLNSRGRPYTTHSIGKVVRRRGVTTYQGRHTFAQAVLDQFDIADVAKLLGHRDLRMALVYAQVRDARARAVVARLVLPGVGVGSEPHL